MHTLRNTERRDHSTQPFQFPWSLTVFLKDILIYIYFQKYRETRLEHPTQHSTHITANNFHFSWSYSRSFFKSTHESWYSSLYIQWYSCILYIYCETSRNKKKKNITYSSLYIRRRISPILLCIFSEENCEKRLQHMTPSMSPGSLFSQYF